MDDEEGDLVHFSRANLVFFNFEAERDSIKGDHRHSEQDEVPCGVLYVETAGVYTLWVVLVDRNGGWFVFRTRHHFRNCFLSGVCHQETVYQKLVEYFTVLPLQYPQFRAEGHVDFVVRDNVDLAVKK